MTEQENFKVTLDYLRPVKAACFRSEWARYEDRSGKLGIRRLTDVAVSAMGQQPGIAPHDDRFIDDCDFYAELAADASGAVHVEGNVLYAGYMRKSWGHFLMNSTARLWPLFALQDNSFDRIVFFSEDDVAEIPHGNFREFLSLLGILDRCVVLPPATYRFDHLTVGDISLELGRYYSREFAMPFEAVRAAALSAACDEETDTAKGIFLSRSKWNGNDRVQINIERMESLFLSDGCMAVSPECVSLVRLIRLMDRAERVVSFSGSTVHNLMFCDDKPFVVLERCAANNIYQIGIMKLKGNRNVLVDCFYQPLLASSTDNLTIYGATAQLERFVSDQGMTHPQFCLSPGREFRRYLKVYRKHYGYGPGINSWEESQAAAVFEAYFASRTRYAAYIDRRRPVLPCDFFSPRVLLRWLRSLSR